MGEPFENSEAWESLQVAEKRQADNIARRSCGEVRSMTGALLEHKFISVTEQANLTMTRIQSGKLMGSRICSLDNK